MAVKTSTLSWQAPPDGGAEIEEYRVLVFEGEQLVDTLTSDTPGLPVQHSATIDRTVLIQARNSQGYSSPLQFIVPLVEEFVPNPPTLAAVRRAGDPKVIDLTLATPGDGNWSILRVLVNNHSANGVSVPGTLNLLDTGAKTIKLQAMYDDQWYDAGTVELPEYVAASVVEPTIVLVEALKGNFRYRFSDLGSGWAGVQLRILHNDYDGVRLIDPQPANTTDTFTTYTLDYETTYQVTPVVYYPNSSGNGYVFSEGTGFTVTTLAQTLFPPSIEAEPGDLQITVTLTDPGSGYVTSQLVCSSSDDNALGDGGVDLTYPYVIENLYNNSEYTVGIIVTDADGAQDQSNILQVTPTRTGFPRQARGGPWTPTAEPRGISLAAPRLDGPANLGLVVSVSSTLGQDMSPSAARLSIQRPGEDAITGPVTVLAGPGVVNPNMDLPDESWLQSGFTLTYLIDGVSQSTWNVTAGATQSGGEVG